ncbi:hypothetical protein l11_00480 [Neisseria weaveri LMG 5135]|nr:hypothetical protein l11_00480 [Neisseria weaveri LMG 5135]
MPSENNCVLFGLNCYYYLQLLNQRKQADWVLLYGKGASAGLCRR